MNEGESQKRAPLEDPLRSNRSMTMDAAGGIYSLKKSLRDHIGSFEREFMYRAGQHGAAGYFASVSAEISKGDPQKAIEKMLAMLTKRGYGNLVLTQIDTENLVVHISSGDTIESWAFLANSDTQVDPVCSYTCGILAAVCRLAFSDRAIEEDDLRCHEVECSAQGRYECRFVIGPPDVLAQSVPGFTFTRDLSATHLLRMNEEILNKNLELQHLNLDLERRVRRRSEDLTKATDNYTNLVALSPSSILITDSVGRIDSMNQAAVQMFGFESSEELKDHILSEFLSGGSNLWDKIVWMLDKEGSVRRHEVELKSIRGKPLQAEISARYVDLLPGRYIVAFLEDVTDRKIMQEQMVDAKSESEFLTDLLAHDITNYMTTALYFLSSMYDSPNLNDEEKRRLRMILKDIQGAFDLSTAVRDLSRARNLSEEDIGASDLQAMLVASIDDAKRMYPNKKIQIRFERSTEPRFVQGSALLTRLLSNMISNSIKFDPSDEVVVEIKVDGLEEQGSQYWRTAISDRGVGIPDSEKERVFERFHRLDQSIAGTGLGLFVARFIASACGGRIWAENRVQGDHTKGTKMVVLLKKSKERDIAQATKNVISAKNN